jgi:hypothetical protein
MGLLNLLQNGTSNLGWDGGPVPPGIQPNVNPNPPGTHHDQYSINGNPVIRAIGAGFVPYIPPPSILEEGDPANTAIFRNAPGLKYLDNPPS